MSFARDLERKRREITFSHNFLEIVAMATMLLDHIALTLILNGKLYGYDAILYNNAVALPEGKTWFFIYRVLRTIGRISFPIFAFLIVEGFRKTSNLFKYVLRILFCALISEIPYNLMVFNKVLCFDVQNVLFTYLIGLLMLLLIKLSLNVSVFISPFIAAVAIIICYLLKTDYWLEGIILMYIYYIFRHDINVMAILTIIVTFILSIEKYYGFAAFSVFFIYFYDGTKGYIDLKRFPYIFYPLHMIVLYLIIFFSYLK